MDRTDILQRTKQLALEIARVVNGLPKSPANDVLGRQLLRSATSIGANYRAVCRAQSRASFIAKMAVVIEESDETLYWLELLFELDVLCEDVFRRLHCETDELTAIFVASRKTAQGRT